MANERARGLGYKFVTDDKYLIDPFSPTDGISYEGDGSPVSYANSGIMTQAPIIYPPVNQGGSDGGGDDGDEEIIKKYTGPSVSPLEAAKQAGMFMINPMGFLANRAFKAYRSRQKQKADFAADQAYRAQQEKDFKEMAANPNNPDGTPAAYNYAGRDNAQGTHTSTVSNKKAQENQDKGRGKYFFGGRVNYKAGGRTDAGPNRTTASKAGVGQINESGQKVSGGNYNNNDGGDNTPVSNYDYSPLIKQYSEQPDYTLGEIELNKNLTNNTRLNSILNLQKTVEDEELTGRLELDNRLGKIDTKLTYGTDQEPKLSASYMNYSPTVGSMYANADSSDGLGLNYAYNNIGANANFNNRGEFERAGITYDNNGLALGLDTQTGASVNFSRDILDGKGQIKAGGTYSPDGTYNATGEISFPFKNGGRAGYFFGGRAGYAEGGAIYSRLGTLSSGVQSAEQQLQSINASLQKAESDLGSDSPSGGSSLAGGPSFTSNFEDANNQGPGSNLLFGGSMDQDSPITAPTTPESGLGTLANMLMPVTQDPFGDPLTGGAMQQPALQQPNGQNMSPLENAMRGFDGTNIYLPNNQLNVDPMSGPLKPAIPQPGTQPQLGPTGLKLDQPFSGETVGIPEQYKAGFDEFKKGKMMMGGQAISYSMLPDGNRVMFGDTGSAGVFGDYLKSIGAMPDNPREMAIQSPLKQSQSAGGPMQSPLQQTNPLQSLGRGIGSIL